MTSEKSAYGTVFAYPDIGSIGTAHLENEPEEFQSLSIILDGYKLVETKATLEGQSLRFRRES